MGKEPFEATFGGHHQMQDLINKADELSNALRR